MNALQGMAQIEAGGTVRPVKFGTNQTAIFCQTQKVTLKQIGELLAPEKLADNDIDPTVLLNFFYSAFAAGAQKAGKDIDFRPCDIGDWIDEDPGLIEELMTIAGGANSPNPNRAQRRAAK